MFRKYGLAAMAGAVIVSVFALSTVSLRRQGVANAAVPQEAELAPQAQVATGQYLWSYATKFVCGYQTPFATPTAPLLGEPIVKAGNYATEINIHNPQYREVRLYKKVLLLVDFRNPNQPRIVREPQSTGPVVTETITLKGDYATMDDCNRIYRWTAAPGTPPLPAFPPPLIVGYLVILSRTELDVDAVYTANAPGANQTAPAQPTGISIDVERVTGKRVFIPAGTVFP